jgi:hypothetical protein
MPLLLRCMSPQVALSGGSQCGDLRQLLGEQRKCNGRTASAAFDANDPKQRSGGRKSRTAARP